jgi:endonuclease-8
MPEGDTVWMTAHVLGQSLTGHTLTGSELRVPQLAGTDLTGWTVAESACHGKHLLLRLTRAERAVTLHSHLRMDGTWRVHSPGARWNARPAHTIRAVLRTEQAAAVGYHLHELALIRTADEHRLIGHLGPDLLGPQWDPAEAVRRLTAHPTMSIAEALLDQRNLAGIGNLYKAEVLFTRRVSPWTKVSEVEDLPGLVTLAQQQLEANRGRWTPSTTGSLRPGETTFVYGRRGRPCRRCGTPVRVTDQGERITYWCPTCQTG